MAGMGALSKLAVKATKSALLPERPPLEVIRRMDPALGWRGSATGMPDWATDTTLPVALSMKPI